MISPCIDILRHLARKVHDELGTYQGTKHTSPNLERDIERLMQSLADHNVYEIENGRTIDPGSDITGDKDGVESPDDAKPEVTAQVVVPNCISLGLSRLPSPLREYNETFRKLQERSRQVPLIGEQYLTASGSRSRYAGGNSSREPQPEATLGEPEAAGSAPEDGANDEGDRSDDDEVSNTGSEDGEEDSIFLERYFSLETAEDVALDMDIVEDEWDELDG